MARTQAELFRSLILWLSEQGTSALSDARYAADERFVQASTVAYPRSLHGDVVGLFRDLPSAGNLMDRSRFIWLEPTPDGMFPIIGLAYDFRDVVLPQVGLRIGLLTLPGDGGDPKGIGYRFESPMGLGGTHDYFHSQPFCSFTVDARWIALPSCPQWMSQSYPAFKLDARTPTQLLACVVVSLYGLRYVALLNQFGADLADAIRDMHAVGDVRVD